MRPPRAWLAAVLALGCAGCSGGATGTTATSPPGPAPPAPEPQVGFTSPREGALTSSTVTATVRLRGVRLAPSALGQAARRGEGHLHFSLDGGRFDRPRYSGANGELAAGLGVAGRYSPAAAPGITYRHLPPGRHTLVVRVANNDHSETRASARVAFSVRP